MQWEFRTFRPQPDQPAREERTPSGVFRFAAKPPLPRRDSYFATADTADWDALTDCLVDYWLKVTEVIPRYYAGRDRPDPPAAEPPEAVAPDNGWDRIICLLSLANGTVTTHLWKGDRPPSHYDRVWIIATFPMIERAAFPERDDQTDSAEVTARRAHTALAQAAAREPARSALQQLRQWRPFTLWTMLKDDEKTLRPLHETLPSST